MKVSENAKRTREHKHNRSLGILRIRTIIWEMEGKTEHLGKIIKEDSPPTHTQFKRAGQWTHCPLYRSVNSSSTLNSGALSFYEVDLSLVLLIFQETTKLFFHLDCGLFFSF